MATMLNKVRLSFPALFHKAVFNGTETKYEATLLLDKKRHAAEIKDLQGQIKELIAVELKGAKMPADRICMRDGDEATYDGYAGCMSLKAANKKRPLIINKDLSIIAEEDSVIYGGCYINAEIEFWVQNNEFGKRINANLLGVQFVGDGEPFGESGSHSSVTSFSVVEDDDEAF